MARGFRHLGRANVPGGGQIFVQGAHAYVGHMRPPHGTSIIDVSDPTSPRLVSQLEVPLYMHSHKVRVHGDIMLVNNETFGGPHPDFVGGLKIYDISDKSRPREISMMKSQGGTHRFDSDGDYAYLSPQLEGYVGNILMTVDIRDPEHPKEVSRWWMPGQWTAGGERPTWEGRRHRCHHPLRRGKDRLYCSYWHGGFFIFDIEDMTKPKVISHLDWSPPFPCPTHTVLPIERTIQGRKIMVVTDEEVADRLAPTPNAFLWTVDITDETNPIPIGTFRVPNNKPFDMNCWFGAHQPQEQQPDGTVIFVTWFAGGLRAVDLADPFRPTEVGHFMPEPGQGQSVAQSNDVFYDGSTGLIYLLDRFGGLDILEFVG